MSLREHTRIRLEGRKGELTQIGQIVVDSLNDLARAHVAGEMLPNHTPASPAFWFHGLAREQSESYGGQFSNECPMASETIRARLSDDAITLARQVLACSCEQKWGSWEGDLETGQPFGCYPCAFDAHGMCSHGCKANHEVLQALDADLVSRGLPPYKGPRLVAVDQSRLEETVAHVLRYGKLGNEALTESIEAVAV